MNKVICDICDTRYDETLSRCPLCGASHRPDARVVADAPEKATAHKRTRGGHFAPKNVQKRNSTTPVTKQEKPAAMDDDDFVTPFKTGVPELVRPASKPVSEKPKASVVVEEKKTEKTEEDKPAGKKMLIVLIPLLLLLFVWHPYTLLLVIYQLS